MSLLHGKNIESATIESSKLTAQAKTDIRSGKLLAVRSVVTAYNFPAASSDDVTTQVQAAAETDTPQSALTAKGIYVGPVSGANDFVRVLIRDAGTDNGLDDGTGDDVYAVLSESSGTFTLSLKKANGSTHTLGSPTNLDFYFVEVRDLDSLPVDALLRDAVGGVVDAITADAALQAQSDADAAQGDIDDHKDGAANKHDATEVDYERLVANRKNIGAGTAEVETALSDLDDIIGEIAAATPGNYTPSSADVVGHLDGLDFAVGAAQSDATTAQGDIDGHQDGGVNKHDATEVDFEQTNAQKKQIADASIDVEQAIRDLDSSILSKSPVRAVASTNIDISLAPASVGGVTLAPGDRVGLAGQTAPAENGIRVFTAVSSPLNRATDLSKASQFIRGVVFTCLEGQFANTPWVIKSTVATLDSDPITIAQSGATHFEQEVPTGTVNGSNVTFALSTLPIEDKAVWLYRDGIIVRQGAGLANYTISGLTITMGTAPLSGQDLYVAYAKP